MSKHATTTFLAGALCLLTASISSAEEPIEEETDTDVEQREEEPDFSGSVDRAWKVETPVTLGLRAGGFSGDDYRRVTAGASEVEVEFEPGVERGRFRLEAPLDVEYRETFGARLRSIRGGAGLDGRWQVSDALRIEPELDLDRVWRPGWPDLYQPIPGEPTDPPAAPTEFQTTNRHGFFSWELGAGAEYRFGGGHRAELGYQYDVTTYDKDPNFRSIQDVDPEPTHLVPYDNRAHEASARWRYRQDDWRVEANLDVEHKSYSHVFARDAGTGLTHAGPGGPPANPLYRTLEWEPAVEGRLELVDDHLTLKAGFGWIVHDDLYEGYYSYSAPHPEVGADWEFDSGVELGVDLDLEWRRYGPNSYEATAGWQAGDSGHPPLQDGDRRVDHRIDVGLDAGVPLGGGWTAMLDGGLDWRNTNFPDYQMGVFPRTRNYDIQWDYTNVHVLAGVEWEF